MKIYVKGLEVQWKSKLCLRFFLFFYFIQNRATVFDANAPLTSTQVF